MESFLKQGIDLIDLAVCSGIWATYQSAIIAASDLKALFQERIIQIMDLLSGSIGEGLIHWHACCLRDAGESLSGTTDWLCGHCRRMCHWLTANDLSHMKRSGRLNCAGAFVGTVPVYGRSYLPWCYGMIPFQKRKINNQKGFLHMRKIKIVADSSANLLSLEKVDFSSAPLKVVTAEREFVDVAELDASAMLDYFSQYKGKSMTSCPNPGDWINAFGDADDIFCVAITSGLSGSYNAACIAKQMYENEHEGARVYVVDSLSAGPELTLIVEQLEQMILHGAAFEDICRDIEIYKQNTGLLFMLESLNNFAANGRVSPAVAKIAGVLGIRIVGKASDQGTLEPTDKCRGETKSLATILAHLKEYGLSIGKVQIAHCRNEQAALKLKAMILSEVPGASVTVGENRGLCSYYAEIGGLLVGYEKR